MTVLSSSVDSDLMQGVGACLGGQTEVFTTITEQQYRRWSSEGGVVGRFWLRLLGWVWHPLRLAGRLISAPRGTTFVVTTNPFFAPALAAWLGNWRGHRVVHHVLDLYPDALEAAGVIPLAGWRSRGLAALTRFTQRRCLGAVYLGLALQRHVENRYGRTPHAAVIDEAADETLFAPPVRAEAPLTLHYGGQLGKMHDAASLAEAVRLLQPEREAGSVRFDFCVGGSQAKVLLDFAGQPGISAGPVLPAAVWRRRVAGMQIGLVSLTPAGARVCFPWKTYSLFAAGLAVLAVAPGASDLAGLVKENGAGWLVDNSMTGSVPSGSDKAVEVGPGIAALVRGLLERPDELRACSDAARQAASTRYSRKAIAGRWQKFLAEVH